MPIFFPVALILIHIQLDLLAETKYIFCKVNLKQTLSLYMLHVIKEQLQTMSGLDFTAFLKKILSGFDGWAGFGCPPPFLYLQVKLLLCSGLASLLDPEDELFWCSYSSHTSGIKQTDNEYIWVDWWTGATVPHLFATASILA